MEDLETFERFYGREFAAQVRRAYLLVDRNDVANDIVQEAMLAVYRRWDSLDNPSAYLTTSVINGCRDALRRRGTVRRKLAALATPAAANEPHDILDDVLAELPFQQRACVVLRYYCGWSAAQIAEALDCSPNSVGPWLDRALTSMREALR